MRNSSNQRTKAMSELDKTLTELNRTWRETGNMSDKLRFYEYLTENGYYLSQQITTEELVRGFDKLEQQAARMRMANKLLIKQTLDLGVALARKTNECHELSQVVNNFMKQNKNKK